MDFSFAHESCSDVQYIMYVIVATWKGRATTHIKARDMLINATLQLFAISIIIWSLIQDETEVYLIGTSIASGQITVITVKPKNWANFRTQTGTGCSMMGRQECLFTGSDLESSMCGISLYHSEAGYGTHLATLCYVLSHEHVKLLHDYQHDHQQSSLLELFTRL